MKLTGIQKINGHIHLVTGLHIGGSETEMHIGGTDNPVIKNPITQEPYIPGSSIKGKMRSLLEWNIGVVAITEGNPLSFAHIKELRAERESAITLLKLFGGAPKTEDDLALIEDIGPTRLSFWDCELNRDWVEQIKDKNLLLTETKMENVINRIKGTAEHPRNTERVPAGAIFDFNLTLRIHDDEDLMPMILKGLKLLELTGLGGSGSRGYGKIRLELHDQSLQKKLEQLDLSQAA